MSWAQADRYVSPLGGSGGRMGPGAGAARLGCGLRPEGRISRAACVECFLFLLPASPSSPAGSFGSVRYRKGTRVSVFA